MCIYWGGCNMKHCGDDTPLQFAPLTQVPNFCPAFHRHIITFFVFLQFIYQCFPTKEARMLRQCTAKPSRAAIEGDGAKLHAVFFWYWCKRKRMRRRRKAFVDWEYFSSESHSAGRWTWLRNPQKFDQGVQSPSGGPPWRERNSFCHPRVASSQRTQDLR